jgi:AcrR family transcriptional regulator
LLPECSKLTFRGRIRDYAGAAPAEGAGPFADRGYDEPTIADIAAAAWVTQIMFFRHLPVKEPMVVDDLYDPVMAHAAAVQAADLPVVERVRCGLLAAWEQLEDSDEAEFWLLRIGASHHGLRARTWEKNAADRGGYLRTR